MAVDVYGRREWGVLRPGVAVSWGLIVLALTSTAWGQGEERAVSIHGFGSWGYGDTDGNRYLTGSEDGEYENVGFSLALTSNPVDRLRISGQIEIFTDPLSEDDAEVEVDYAFAEWLVSDHLHLRLGRSKHPFGIYAEIFDVGTLRPFFDLPQSVYGPVGLAGENYDGIGLTYFHLFDNEWKMQLDVYAGSLRFESFEPWDGLRDDDDDLPGDDEVEELFETKQRDDLVGFRLAFETPIPNLSFGLSAYTGDVVEDEFPTEGEISRHVGYGLHVDYDGSRWTARAELAHIDEEEELESDGVYLELAYMLDEHWQLAARFDDSETDVEELDVSELPSLATHRDLAFGVNYWFSTNLVVKLAVHQVEGNRLALPEEADEAIDLELLDDETTLISFGAQFSF